MFRQPPTSRTQLRIVLGDHPFLEIFTEMHIESTSLSNDQLKSSLIPLVFQREALLSADPQLDATDENNLPPEVQMRSSRQRASSTTAKTPKRKFSLASPSSPEKFSPSSGAKRNSALLRHDEIDPIHLKGTEMWPLADEHGRPSNRDIGAGWVPIYISQCSTINNPIFEDDRHVIVTDHHIHVTKPLIREKTDDYRTAFEFSIRISRIVEVLSGNSTHFFFQQVFPEVTIKFQEMKLIKPPGQRIPLKNYSVANSVSTLVLRTSRRAWQLPLYISRAQTNSNIRSLYSTAAYHDLQDVRDFEHLERRLCNAVRVNPLGKLQVHLVDIERKAHWMKEMGELATANRAVKTAFWKSMTSYRYIFDEIESCFIVVKRFVDEHWDGKPKRRTEAHLAALVGLKEHPHISKPERVSEEHALLTIRYVRRCLQLLTLMLFDTEQAPARMNMFRITSPYGFCDLVKIIIVGQCLESFIRGPFASNLRHERKKPKTETPKTSHGLAKLFEDFKIINTSAQPRLNRRGSTDSDSVTSMDDSPGNIGPAPPPSPWANVPVRHIPGARRRSRVSINGMSAAFASWNGDSRSSISSRGWHNSAYSSINLSDKSQSNTSISKDSSLSNSMSWHHRIVGSYAGFGNDSSPALRNESYSGYQRRRRNSINGVSSVDGISKGINLDEFDADLEDAKATPDKDKVEDQSRATGTISTAEKFSKDSSSQKDASQHLESKSRSRSLSLLSSSYQFETEHQGPQHSALQGSGEMVYTGDSGRVDLWKARYHSKTKSAFRMQSKLEETAQREHKRREKSVMDGVTLRSSLSQQRNSLGNKESNAKGTKVTFDVLDVTALLALPLPPLPKERVPLKDPWYTDSDEEDQEKVETHARLDTQAAALLKSSFSMAVLSSNANLNKEFMMALHNGFPTAEQFEETDLHPKQAGDDSTERVHSALLPTCIDAIALLWEVCFAAQLDTGAATLLDALLVSNWIGKLHQHPTRGWYAAVGGLSSAMHFVVTVVTPSVGVSVNAPTAAQKEDEIVSNSSNAKSPTTSDTPSESSEVDTSTEDGPKITEHKTVLFSDLLPARVLVAVYRTVLLINHTVFVARGSSTRHDDLAFWEEEFKYVLTVEVVRKRFGHDARPISQDISTQLIKLIHFLQAK